MKNRYYVLFCGFFLHLITVALMFIIELCSYAYLTLGGTVSSLYFVSDVFIFLTRILQII